MVTVPPLSLIDGSPLLCEKIQNFSLVRRIESSRDVLALFINILRAVFYAITLVPYLLLYRTLQTYLVPHTRVNSYFRSVAC